MKFTGNSRDCAARIQNKVSVSFSSPRAERSINILPPAPDHATAAKRFLAEVLAVSAGVEVGGLSVRELGDLCGETRYCDAEDNLDLGVFWVLVESADAT